jgi:protein-S-isoprenylcysteine O-methyltransferase Ste14
VIRLQAIVALVLGAIGLGALLFLSAGTTDWRAARVWLALFVAAGVAATLLSPTAVLAERLQRPVRAGQPDADIIWMALFGPLLLGWFVLAGLDAVRFGWSDVPTGLQAVGVAVFVLANALAVWVLRTNPFAAASVRVADDHVVATTGPYAIVRHPMYSSVVLYFPGTALVLGSYVATAAAGALVVGLAMRTGIEERALRDGLPGYAEYAARVRWRLVPGVW